MRNSLGKLMVMGLGLLTFPAGAQPVITGQPATQTVVWGGNATFSVMATGVGPLTYQWQLNGTNLPSNLITTVAGGNLFNNQQGTNTILNSPQGCVRDSLGNVYVADSYNHVVRKLDTNGLMTIVAGNGSASFSGDGGPATNAGIWSPGGVAIDTNQNLYISDYGNNRIRKVDTNGIIFTYAGNGNIISSGDYGAATNGSFGQPAGIALDATGNLFIAETWNHRIRKVSTSGIITTVAGSSSMGGFYGDGGLAIYASLNYPNGVAVDSSGNIYIADSFNYRIRKVNTAGYISTFAGTGTAGYTGDGGSATSAKISSVSGLAVDNRGNVFIADTGNNCIRKITNNIITTVAGNGTAGFAGDGAAATSANLNSPYQVAADTNGNLYIADEANNRIRKMAANGMISTLAGRDLERGIQATNTSLNLPCGVSCDRAGNIYVSESGNSRIRKVDTNGVISMIAGNGIPVYAGDGGPATNASLKWQYGTAVDAFGNLFIADRANYRVRKVDTNGIITTVAGKGVYSYSGDGGAATNAGLMGVYDVDVDNSGSLFVAEATRIRKVDANGIISTVAGNGSYSYSGDGGAATIAGLGFVNAVEIDPAGNVYIATVGNNGYLIRKVDTMGIISTVVGNGSYGYSGDGGLATNAQIGACRGMAFDSEGNFFIADASYQRIRKVGTNGIISTVVGNGTMAYSGDNGPSGVASISSPGKIFIDDADNLLIADWGNNRIRKVSYLEYANQPTFTAANMTPDNATNVYTVVVTSASGSVTSSVVSVNLQLPPIEPAFVATKGTLQFTWGAVSNLTYQLQCATNLAAPIWENLGSPVTATNGTVSVPGIPAGSDNQFFRVLWVP